MQYDSFLPPSFKRKLISGLIYRAWKICSSEDLFQQELIKLKKMSIANGFPLGLINRLNYFYINKKHLRLSLLILAQKRESFFFLYPFVVKIVSKLVGKLVGLLTKLHFWSSVKIVFRPICRLNNAHPNAL